MKRNRTLFSTLSVLLLSASFLPAQHVKYGPCGLPPERKPQRIKAGEAFPPLPLPATPLRRTERKRDPAPPTLIGKIRWGQTHTVFLSDGRRVRFSDWNLDPSDMQGLLKAAARKLKIRYKHEVVSLRSFHFDPARVPILFITGAKPFSFDPATRKKLRSYLEKGGFLWGEACWGSQVFRDAFRAEMKKIFPGRPLMQLPPAHPLFRCTYAVDHVRYSRWVTDRPEKRPVLEGIYLGCRTAVIFSPYDLTCAWDSMHVKEGAWSVVGWDAFRIGLNMITYSVAWIPYGKYWYKASRTSMENDPNAQFVLAQLKHGGNWDPYPAAFANLAKAILTRTNVRTTFKRVVVSASDPNLMNYPFLYVTGTGEFRFTDNERACLRNYLRGGGFLMADAACGDLAFDSAFRREMARIVPGVPLQRIPADSPLYAAYFPVRKVELTPRARATGRFKGLPLMGIGFDGALRVVYSPLGLGSGLERVPHPFSLGVVPGDAEKLFINSVVYAMSH